MRDLILLKLELFEAFNHLDDEFKKIDKKYNSLKRDHVILTNEFNILKIMHGKYILISYTSCFKYEDLKLFNLELKKELFKKL